MDKEITLATPLSRMNAPIHGSDVYDATGRLIAGFYSDDEAELVVSTVNAVAALRAQVSALEVERDRLREALQFCGDFSEEELALAKVETGVEVALRHIRRKARAALAATSEGE